jgi:non-ribosomal peptide synthetase component F
METLGLTAKHLDIDNGASRFDMTLAMTETEEGYEVDIEYPTDLYRRERIERMTKHLENILESVVGDPTQRLSDLPLLSENENRQLLIAWNETDVEYPSHSFIHELFEAQTRRTPDAVAVVFEGDSLTYRELNEQANRVARYLREAGVESGELVGLLTSRSLRMVVGLLGILKAGGAYLPLDERFPAERLAFMREDSGARVVLSDAEWTKINDYSTENLDHDISNEQRAYVIYTSGSTGQPKGVEVSHRSVVNLLHSMSSQNLLNASDTMLAVTTLSFDIAAAEVATSRLTACGWRSCWRAAARR